MEHQGAQNTSRSHHYNGGGGGGTGSGGGGGGGGGGREDCWSEGATAVLIEAWGDRYLQLSRGNLRQKDWKDVADAVNGRADGAKPRRTDIQCKNRIDTIKKKYKLEKSKPAPSQWPFYSRLDHLIGTATATAPGGSNKKITPTPPPPPHPPHSTSFYKPPPVTFTVKHHHGKGKFYSPNPNLNHSAAVYSGGSSSKSRLNSPGSTESSGGVGAGGADDDDDDDDDDIEDDELLFRGGSSRKHRMDRDVSNGTAFRELAKAVLKFGEIYERIENSKQQQMMELERQRMEFTKDLEFQRMQMFMDAQLELEKMKRPKYSSTAGKKS